MILSSGNQSRRDNSQETQLEVPQETQLEVQQPKKQTKDNPVVCAFLRTN
jgi:hypothetical protein